MPVAARWAEAHLGFHDGLDGCFKLLRVVVVHRPHVGLADEVLCVGVLGEHLAADRQVALPAPRPQGPQGLPPLTSLDVGLPRKNSWLRELWGGLKRDCRKTQPLAMASSGAGPS